MSMNKGRCFGFQGSMVKSFLQILTSASILMLSIPNWSGASQKLEELEIQQQELESESQKIGNEIQNREEKMQALENEKIQLEEEVEVLQADIDDLVIEISEQEKEIDHIKEEIEQLKVEIARLQEQIDKRNEQLESQARSVQTNANPSDIVDLLMSAESLTDLVGRIGVVNKLVSANQDIMAAQIADQKTLEETEAQVKREQEEVENVMVQLEVSRSNLVNQRGALDDKIIQIAAQYEMTDKEFFAGLKSEKAETLQHWMGKDDFFFCHWYAEDEQSIIDVLEQTGFNDIIVTMPNEMQRYVSSDKITNEKLVDPFDT